jgi:hypothetical protein
MIRKKTVLVLGAGSSMPYTFPSGRGLRDEIRSFAKLRDDTPPAGLIVSCGISLAKVRALGDAFRHSGILSIDAFLERHPDLVDTGKILIATKICEREYPDRVTGREDDNWYEYLWHYMHTGAKQPEEICSNRIRFLTFNYDRSLEFFLFDVIKNTFIVDDDDAVAAMRQIEIRHIYGAVGDFHYKDTPTARAYTGELDAARLRLAADGIKIIPNARKDDAVFQEARDWFDWAEDICFLGFGFDKTNCERLGLEDAIQTRQRDGRSTPRVLASVLGLTQQDINAAIVATCRTTGFVPLNHSNLMALRSTDLFRE